MKADDPKQKKMEMERRMIYEMINASIDLAEKLGPHDLAKGCNCIACVDKRKRLIAGDKREWKYTL